MNFVASSAATQLLYTGDMRDIATGQLYLRARWYDANVSRFGRLDPLIIVNSASISSNNYIYAFANCTSIFDPTGELGTIAGLAVRSFISGVLLGLVGGAIGGADAYFGGGNLVDITDAAVNGFIVGGSVGAAMPFLIAWLGPIAVAKFASYFVYAGIGMSAAGASYSFLEGEVDQGIFRLAVGFIGAQRAAATVAPQISAKVMNLLRRLLTLRLPASHPIVKALPTAMRLQVPPLPQGMTRNRQLGSALRWDEAGRAANLTLAELKGMNLTQSLARQWRNFYVNESIRNPNNFVAPGRAEVLQRAVELLSLPF